MAAGLARGGGAKNRRRSVKDNGLSRPRDTGIDRFPGERRQILFGQEQMHVVDFRALALVNHHGVNTFMAGQVGGQHGAQARAGAKPDPGQAAFVRQADAG